VILFGVSTMPLRPLYHMSASLDGGVPVGTRATPGIALAQISLVTAIAQHLLDWLTQHTYAVVFLAALIDATAIPFPGRLVLAAAGAVAATGQASATTVIVLGTLGIVITDHAWYLAGLAGVSDRLVRLYCRVSFGAPDCVRRTTDLLRRYGALVIAVGRFVAAVRVLAWPLARQHGVGYLAFLGLDVVAAVVWTSVWVTLGWFLGPRWAAAPAEIRWASAALAAAAVLAVAVVRWWRRPTGPTGTAAPASREWPAGPRAHPRP
jgi:membrane protein DedA with SNARE-associated domain